ncbi:MAG: polysulfide reductase NrfD [Halorubrum sp.]
MATAADGVFAPLTTFSKKFIGLVAVLGLVSLVMLEAVIHQLRHGLVVTDLASWGTQEGVTWGIYIGTFEWFAGMAVGCIAVVGFIRYRELDRYDVIARIGEIWGLISGLSAAYLIVLDLGRPDRVLNILTAWFVTVQYSPLAWDVTFVTALLVMTSTMLILSLRRDFSGMNLDELPVHAKLLGTALTAGYRPDEDEKLASMLRWLGLALLILAFTGGMVPGWLLGVVGAQAGYYGGIAGVSFLAGGLLTGVAAIALIAGILRALYGWDELLPTEVFVGVGKALTVFGFVYLVILFNEMLPKLFPMAPLAESRIGEAMLYGHFATDFWLAMAAIAIPVVILAAFRERMIVKGVGLAIVSVPMLWAVFVKKQLVVIEPLLYPSGLPYEVGTYVPTLVEWVIAIGAIVVAILLFAVATRLVPMSRQPSEIDATADVRTEVSD